MKTIIKTINNKTYINVFGENDRPIYLKEININDVEIEFQYLKSIYNLTEYKYYNKNTKRTIDKFNHI